MFKRALVIVLAGVLLVSSVRGGFDRAFITATSRDGKTIQAEVPSGTAVDVIVEFRDAPLFAAPRASASAATRADRHRILQSRFADFANALRSMRASSSKQSQSTAGDAPRITNQYERVFAGVSATVFPADIAAIRSLGYVKAVYPDSKVEALEIDRASDVALADSVAKIKADRVWSEFGTRGAGVVVAIIDTGVDYTHPTLGGSFGPRARVIGGWDFVNKDNDPMDDQGHGTHVAGIIGGDGAGLVGVAPDVHFLAYKALGKTGSGKQSDVIAAVERASDPDQDRDPADHADVVNMSLGGGGDASDPLSQAVETATSAGIVFSIAAGNSGGFYTIGSPAVAPSVIAVGATDVNDAMAIFSSGGPAGSTLVLKPEIVAPGVSIVSASPGGGTVSKSGTSMATPHVAGVAALLKALHPDWTPADVKSAIVNTAELLNADVMAQGGGRVDALRAAGTQVSVDPPVISLGRDDPAEETWSITRTLSITDRSTEPVTLAVSVTGATGAVNLAVEPATLTLAPGETRTITLVATVKNPLLPFPLKGSLALSGHVVLTGGKEAVRVPWAFVKAARMHVTYDQPGTITALVTGTASSPMPPIFRSGEWSVDAFTPPGDYYVLLQLSTPSGGDTLFRFLMAPLQHISGDASVAFSSTTPVTMIDYIPTTTEGTPLVDLGHEPGFCGDLFIVTYPADSKIQWTGLGTVRTSGIFHVAVSEPPEGVSYTGSEACWDGKSSMYVAQFGSFQRSSETIVANVDPSSWMSAPIGMVVPEGAQNPAVLIGASVTSSLITPAIQSARIPVTGGSWSGKLFITPEEHPSVKTIGLLRLTADVGTVVGSTVIDAGAIRGTHDGIVVSRAATATPSEHVAPAGSVLMFGDGLAYPQTMVYAGSGYVRASGSWYGALNETRPLDGQGVTAVIRDSSGKALFSGALPAFAVIQAAGAYDAEITKVFKVGGLTSTATLTTRVDSGVAETAAPMLTSIRILDGNGRQTSNLGFAERGTLRFSAIDLTLDPVARTNGYEYVVSGRTTASWRPHGSTEWHPLPIEVGAQEMARTFDDYLRLGHAPAGTVFTADLSAAASAVTGPIDLQVHVEGAAGNFTTFTIAPASVVKQDRRRAAHH